MSTVSRRKSRNEGPGPAGRSLDQTKPPSPVQGCRMLCPETGCPYGEDRARSDPRIPERSMTRHACRYLAVLFTLALPPAAHAAGEGATYRATLDGASEVPPRNRRGMAKSPPRSIRRPSGSAGRGATATLPGRDRRPFPRSGHPGENAGVLVPLTAATSPFTVRRRPWTRQGRGSGAAPHLLQHPCGANPKARSAPGHPRAGERPRRPPRRASAGPVGGNVPPELSMKQTEAIIALDADALGRAQT